MPITFSGFPTPEKVSIGPDVQRYPGRKVGIISIGQRETFHALYGEGLLASLANAGAAVAEVDNAPDALALFTDSPPHAVLITTAQAIERKFRVLHLKLVDYVKAGGTVVYCGLFSSFTRPPNFKRHFTDVWSLPWEFGSYTKVTPELNPNRHATLHRAKLLRSYEYSKANFVTGIQRGDAVYIPSKDELPSSGAICQAPSVFISVGNGRLGYIGDVNEGLGPDQAILAMCGFLDWGTNSICTCGNRGDKKCGRCNRIEYCSKDCQVKDWGEHKKYCEMRRS
jgi:MYND finger